MKKSKDTLTKDKVNRMRDFIPPERLHNEDKGVRSFS